MRFLFLNAMLLRLFLLLNFFRCISQNTNLADEAHIILNKKCISCHHQAGYAPFSLEKPEDFRKRKQFVGYVIQNKLMPPWKADVHYRDFANNKSLSETEIKKVTQWLDLNCPDWSEKSPAIKYVGSSQLISKPNLILKMKNAFIIPPINQNVYICYKIPFEIKRDTFISAIEFVPGNKSAVHHVSYQILEVDDDVDVHTGPEYFLYDADTLNRVNDEHDYKYFNLIGKSGKFPRDTYHGGWLPGTSVQKYPSSIGIRLPKKGVLLIRNLHYSPVIKEESDQSGFNIYYAKKKPTRAIGFAAFKPKNPTPDGEWMIKANDSAFAAHINVKFHNDVSLLNINPHMHRLGKRFVAYAVTPSSDTIPLVKINDWDFNWQEFYRFKRMIKIPAGSIIRADAVYDNSTQNENNPYNPPRDIKFEWGMNDDSEMMRLVFLYLPYQPGDENISLE